MKILREIFSETNGKLSSKRVLSGVLVLVFVVNYMHTAILTRTMVDIPNNWTMLLFGLLGLLSATTIFQKKK